MLKEEPILHLFFMFIIVLVGFVGPYAFAERVTVRESRVEIGRSIASESAADLRQLNHIQSKYNKLQKLKNLKPLLKNSLNKQDKDFFGKQDQEVVLPKARIVGNELHLIAKDGVVKVLVLDLKLGKFEINKHIWQLSKPLQLKNDLVKIDQILKKSYVLGTDSGAMADSAQNSMAIYGLGFLATSQALRTSKIL